jgi:hypothetical protein
MEFILSPCFLSIPNNAKGPIRGSRWSYNRILQIRGTALTLGAGAIFCTPNQALLRVVRNIRRKDGEYQTNIPISTNYLHAVVSSFNQRLKDEAHGRMEELLVACFNGLFCQPCPQNLVDRQIADKNAGTLRRLSTESLGNISECQVDRIR